MIEPLFSRQNRGGVHVFRPTVRTTSTRHWLVTATATRTVERTTVGMATAQVSAVEAEVDMKMRADMEPALVGTATRLMAVMVGTVMTPMVPVMALIRAMGTVMRARVSAVEAMEMDMKLMRATAAMEMAISCDELGYQQVFHPSVHKEPKAVCF